MSSNFVHPAGRNAPAVVVILDDDEQRIAQMSLLLSSIGQEIAVRHFDNAPDFLRALPTLLPVSRLFSLDHDLGPIRHHQGISFDPGIGRAVSEALAELPPTCPILIHTSNAPAAQGMLNDLAFAGWQTLRVVPHSDLAWIRADWLPVVTRILAGTD